MLRERIATHTKNESKPVTMPFATVDPTEVVFVAAAVVVVVVDDVEDDAARAAAANLRFKSAMAPGVAPD